LRRAEKADSSSIGAMRVSDQGKVALEDLKQAFGLN